MFFFIFCIIYYLFIYKYFYLFPFIRFIVISLTFSTSLPHSFPSPTILTTHSFNLRDLSRVYEGLCNADLDVITTQNQFVRLWRNECDRVICDRLTTIEDRQLYLTQMHSVIQGTYVFECMCVLVYVFLHLFRTFRWSILDYFLI